MDKLYIILIAAVIAGCSNNREVTIETSPAGSKFMYKNKQFITPAKIKLPLEGDIVLNQEGYKSYTVSNDSFGNSDHLKVKLDKLPLFKVDIVVGNVKYYNAFIDNRKVSTSSVALNEGEYNIRMAVHLRLQKKILNLITKQRMESLNLMQFLIPTIGIVVRN